MSFLLLGYVRAHSTVIIMNGLSHEHILGSTNEVRGYVELKNTGRSLERVVFYLNDLENQCASGQLLYQQLGENPRSLAEHLHISATEYTLQPNEVYRLGYSITGLGLESKTGSFWSVLMIELAEPINTKKQQAFQINSKVRYAVQLIANVGEKQAESLSFAQVEFDEENPSLLKVRMKNDGLFSLKSKVNIEVFDANGTKIFSENSAFKRLYPLNCNLYTFDLSALPKGKYDGVLVADTGTNLFGTNFNVELE
ncbi:hypothetical protein LAG90_11660 [Marinilongibacter aquaticus]|uniref:hypothetical protein n=1 Tax=Marinilongibacter aquaticus TaxID=2975157 RepID=UPI0021BDDBD9|nr:hypothetical protein [Marinilongibacter aquaticus]UBM57475.1 hypothetical protein LAG90_11660 [Marinilongibacter aquaticus]